MKNVKMPMKAVMLCKIDGETFNMFTKNMWIEYYDTSCHITSNDTILSKLLKPIK